MRFRSDLLGAFVGSLALLFVLLAGGAAQAGSKSIFAGPVFIRADERYGCSATNVSNRTLTNARVVIRIFNAETLLDFSCGDLEPLEACNSGSSLAEEFAGWTSCEATSDQGAKGLRATFMNITTGNSSDAR